MYCVYGNSGWYIHGGPLFGGGPLLGGSVIGGSTVHVYIPTYCIQSLKIFKYLFSEFNVFLLQQKPDILYPTYS